MLEEVTQFRDLAPDERRLLEVFISRYRLGGLQDLDSIKVKPLSDGGMGSLSLYPKGCDETGRKFGRVAAELTLQDGDGVQVLVTLNLDQKGRLFELDVWKANFEKITSFSNLTLVPES